VKIKIGVKYCGGCNPEYDRVAAVEYMQEQLQDTVAFVAPETDGVDLILAVEGCSTACADLSAFQGMEVKMITCLEDVERFLKEIQEK